ncbi:hypothetical protein ABLG96_13165 [Nakamurella sp. A5-74]|uniref:Uncharacterized protein n=1 Tax=Nakamurella sp. A5-74 TaxID=3158264 RepID=A0AAU8DJU1_9ACTN
MSELRTEARLLLQTVEDRLLEWRSLIPATDPAAQATDPAAQATDPAAQATDPAAQATDPAAQATDPTAPATGPTARATDAAGSAADHPAADHAEHQGTAGCPLCTVLAVVRGERPELAVALLDGAVTALQLVRSLVSEQSEQSEQSDPEGAAAAPPTLPAPEPALPAAAQRPPPERIRIS